MRRPGRYSPALSRRSRDHRTVSRWLERLLGLPLRRMPAYASVSILICTVIFLVALTGSALDVWRYPGEDLRPKVVAVRAILRGLNPYAYEVGPETPEQLIDYTRPWARMAGSHKSPAILLLYAPTSSLPWRSQRLLWMVVEWMAMIGSILLLSRCCRRPTHRLAFICIACYFFVGGHFWRLHVERGQDYVFLVLLQALGVSWLMRRRHSEVVSGLPIGAAMALRPTLLALAPVLWLIGLRRMASSGLATSALVILATLPLVGLTGWVEFQRAVTQLEQIALGNKDLDARLGQPYRPSSPIVEGYDYSVRMYIPPQSQDLTLTYLGGTVLPRVQSEQPLRRAWPLITRSLAVLTVIGFAGLAWIGHRRGLSTRAGLALAILGGLAMDYLVGVVRTSYTDVGFLVPIALLLPILLDRRTPRLFGIMVLSGLVAGSTGWVVLGVILRSVGVFGGLALCAAWLCLGARPKASPPLRGSVEA